MPAGFSLAIHGGAGVPPRGRLTPSQEAERRAGLDRALAAGEAVLARDGGALDAVVAAVCTLEDEPLFNAGRGAVFTRDGRHEMDAALMDGRDRRAGAVAGICGPRNPILAARAVMERTEHVFMIGEGALEAAREAGLPFDPPERFFTQERWDALQETLRLQAAGISDDDDSRRHGTVGAVARDRRGALAAATSTGGMTGKRAGRVGDSPVIGAGVYADDAACAVSATGDGEAFLRLCVGHEIAARMRLAGQSLAEAAEAVVTTGLTALGGGGGVVAVDREGRVSLPFNCDGMHRGFSLEGGPRETAVY